LGGGFDLREALSRVVGQARVKEALLRFEKGVALQLRRRDLGIQCDAQWPPHMLFRGNPGTGKTSIARLVGRGLQALGVLKRGHLVECGRGDLVAGAVGQTALKTREKIKEAKGGVLFVDEAYTLAPGSGRGDDGAGSRDFGREAINELMAAMNDGGAQTRPNMQNYTSKHASKHAQTNVQTRPNTPKRVTWGTELGAGDGG
jgi:SpoVK/Ycf46/Vps4 family AAA+-type ATPase